MVSHIAVLTGKRGGFGAMKAMMRRLRDHRHLGLRLIVTDQHLDANFGNTAQEIRQEFEIAAEVPLHQANDTALARAQAMGRCCTGIAEALAHLQPEMLLLYGDRGEVLAAALAAAHLRIPMGHLQAGDMSGNIDDVIRHAVTKLSHLHFASCEDSACRLRHLGEEPWRIHTVGDNHVDMILSAEIPESAELRQRYAIEGSEQTVLFLMHPETLKQRHAYQDACLILEKLMQRYSRILAVYPCSDHGFQGIVEALQRFEGRPGFSLYRNIPAADFAGLMSLAHALVGNSSAAIVEAPYFGLPALNIGERQSGRMRAQNVLDCPWESEALEVALNTLSDSDFRRQAGHCDRPYGDGQAGQKIVKVLETMDFADPKLLNKKMLSPEVRAL